MKQRLCHFFLIGQTLFGLFLILHGVVDAASFSWPAPPDPQNIPTFRCQIEERYPHDSAAFTQGLFFEKGHFYEGTGLYGRSSLRRVDFASGKVLKSVLLPSRLFGEGIAPVGNRIYQLTWRSQEVRVYDLDSLKLSDQHFWPYQGWGVTSHNKFLVISDGTNTLFFVDPDKFTIKSKVAVIEGDQPLTRLNELETVDNYILANVWQTARIVVIVPDSGQVSAWIDLADIATKEPAGVANGIAWDSANRRLFVTGKRWSHVYEVTLRALP